MNMDDEEDYDEADFDDDDNEEDEEEDDNDEYVDDYAEDDSDDDNDVDAPTESILEGKLSIDDEFKLNYKGNAFNFTSIKPLDFNILDAHAKPPQQVLENNVHYLFEMDGTCDIIDDDSTHDGDKISGSSPEKSHPTRRRIQVTWTEQNDESKLETEPQKLKGRLKDDEGFDDVDDDQPKKASAQLKSSKIYQLYGKEIQSSELNDNKLLELKGDYKPVNEFSTESITILVSHIRYVDAEIEKISVVNSSPSTTAAASRLSNDNSDDDDYGDTGVDYDELIALHEDANIPVESVRKRLRNGTDNGNDTTPKKFKPPPSSRQDEDDDEIDDDDDVGF
jgi:hypothetical protein